MHLDASKMPFGADVDWAVLVKVYGGPQENETRYSPANIQSSTTEAAKASRIRVMPHFY